MILPDHVAGEQKMKEQQMQRTAMVLHHRAEFAAKIYAELIAQEYQEEVSRHVEYGIPYDFNFELPSKVAVDAATALLFRLNMISAEEFEASKAERVNGSP